MSYFAIRADFHRHAKGESLAEHGPEVFSAAIAIWSLAGSWCADHGSGGFVPVQTNGNIGSPRNPLSIYPLAQDVAEKAIAALVQARLWKRVDGGYQFNKWELHNFTAEETKKLEDRRAKDRQRKRQKRASDHVSAETSADNSAEFRADIPGGHSAEFRDAPDPDPDPDPSTLASAQAGAHARTRNDQACNSRGKAQAHAPVRGQGQPEIVAPGANQRASECTELANAYQDAGQAVGRAANRSWKGWGTAGPARWAKVLRGWDQPISLDGMSSAPSVAECRHAIAMAAAEARELCELGATDPLGFLRAIHEPGVFARCAAYADEAEAKEAARSSGRGRSVARKVAPARGSSERASTISEVELEKRDLDDGKDLW